MLDAMIKKQHSHFAIDYSGPARSLDAEEEAFRLAAMLEELSEFILAKTIEDKYDALLDLIVFASGTLERMGLPIEPGLNEVLRANLEKRLGAGQKRGGFKLDLIKPPEWKAPDLKGLIK